MTKEEETIGGRMKRDEVTDSFIDNPIPEVSCDSSEDET